MSGEIRPFPVRFDPVQRERLDLLSQLTGRSATDIVREGTERLMDELSAKPEIRARVDNLVSEIRKEAEDRQAAVNAMFGLGAPDAEQAPNEGSTGAPELDLNGPDDVASDGSDTPADPAEPEEAAVPAKKTTASRRSPRTSGK